MTARLLLCALSLAVGSLIVVNAQGEVGAKEQALLKRLFSAATAFSPKGGDPPHFRALATEPKTGAQTLLGVAFWTTELDPLERGYDGPIKILVGMDPKGVLTGIIVAEHKEPYGNFSIDLPAFAGQFSQKNIRDPFKVGTDIDAVSRATLSVTSASRAVRNSARRVAKRLLTPEPAK